MFTFFAGKNSIWIHATTAKLYLPLTRLFINIRFEIVKAINNRNNIFRIAFWTNISLYSSFWV
jgi:hypothetical protein